jgi:hypothetical protein
MLIELSTLALFYGKGLIPNKTPSQALNAFFSVERQIAINSPPVGLFTEF